jgi:hypothetical protein
MTLYETVGKIMSLGSKYKGATPGDKAKAINEGAEILNNYSKLNTKINITIPELTSFADWLKDDDMLKYDSKHLAEWFIKIKENETK